VSPLNIPRRPILDEQFQKIYDIIKDIPPGQITENNSEIRNFEKQPKLAQIGTSVWATSTITPPSSLTAETDIRYCLDTLFGTTTL